MPEPDCLARMGAPKRRARAAAAASHGSGAPSRGRKGSSSWTCPPSDIAQLIQLLQLFTSEEPGSARLDPSHQGFQRDDPDYSHNEIEWSLNENRPSSDEWGQTCDECRPARMRSRISAIPARGAARWGHLQRLEWKGRLAKPLYSFGRGERVERHVPIVGRNVVARRCSGQPTPTRRASLSSGGRARDRNGLCRGQAGCRGGRSRSVARGPGRARRPGRLGFGCMIPNGPGSSGSPARKRNGFAGLSKREGDDRADRARFLHRQQRADFAIRAAHSRRRPRLRRKARSGARQAAARAAPARRRTRVATNALRASSAAARSDSLRQRLHLRPAGRAEKGGDGTTMAVCPKIL